MNFDIPYLIDRAKTLNVRNFAYLGRLKGKISKLTDTKFSSKAYVDLTFHFCWDQFVLQG